MDQFSPSVADDDCTAGLRDAAWAVAPRADCTASGSVAGLGSVPLRSSDLAALRARTLRSFDQLNRGEVDEVLSRYSDEVTLLLPDSKAGDPVRERMIHGKAGFRNVLLRFAAAYAPLRLLDIQLDPPNDVCLRIGCRRDVIMNYRLSFDAAGLGRRVVVSIA